MGDIARRDHGGKPRASGDDPARCTVRRGVRHVNPARAGMIRVKESPAPAYLGKPRASGDDPVYLTPKEAAER